MGFGGTYLAALAQLNQNLLGWIYLGKTVLGSANAMIGVDVPSGYSQLFLVFSVTATGANASVYVRFNADAGNHYNYEDFHGAAAIASAAATANADLFNGVGLFQGGENVNGLAIISNIATVNKSLSLFGGGKAFASLNSGYWANATDLISHIDVFTGNTTFTAESKVLLYGAV